MTSIPNSNDGVSEEISKTDSMKSTPQGISLHQASPNETISIYPESQYSHEAQSLDRRPSELDHAENGVPSDPANRASRDEEESIALARALMAEEAMAASYAMSMDYLRNNRDQFSEEDLAALQAAMDDDDDERGAEDHPPEDGGMSYELMLRLGDRIGDVKSERWATVAGEKIAQLGTFLFDVSKEETRDMNDCDAKCLICQFQYEDKESLRRLPCKHAFHTECVDQWLMTKDFCPYCRQAIVKEI